VAAVRTADAMRSFLADLDAALERRAFGTSDLDVAAELLEGCCARALAPVDDCLFYHSNVGMAAGFTLTDGRRVVAKVHGPGQTRARLKAVQRVQGRLADAGYPCPRPLGVAHCAHAFVTLEEMRTDGVYRDAHEPGVAETMARALAEQVAITGTVDEVLALTREPIRAQRDPWRDTRHPRFDFEGTREGAEWIDAIAAEALARLRDDPGEIVVGHIDWRVEQMRFTGDRISVAYDWDSLVRDSETTIVGYASRAFPLAWERGGTRLWPTLDEQVAFVDAYEATRGRPFSRAERRAIAAAAAFQSAYGARCEHAVAGPGEEPPPDSQRAGLATQGGSLFDMLG
jgi:hypothetical protein